MKKLLIYASVLLLTSCSLFESIPSKVVEGQRAVYQGIILAQENDVKIIKRYIADNVATITYHINFVFESKINNIRKNPDLDRGEKSQQITILEQQRQAQLDEACGNIKKIGEDMMIQAMKNHEATKKLVESIYNYLSTTPIEIDNLEFWIEKLKEVSER